MHLSRRVSPETHARHAIPGGGRCARRHWGFTGALPPPYNNRLHAIYSYPGRPDAQSEEHRPGFAARQTHRVHRPIRFGKVVAGVRHDLCRGPTPLRRVAVDVRPAIPLDDGKAGYRHDRRTLTGYFDRTEIDLPQSALDGRNRD